MRIRRGGPAAASPPGPAPCSVFGTPQGGAGVPKGKNEVAKKGSAAVPSIPLKAGGWHSSWLSFLGLMGHQEPSSMNWISSQSVQELRISMNNLSGGGKKEGELGRAESSRTKV